MGYLKKYPNIAYWKNVFITPNVCTGTGGVPMHYSKPTAAALE